MGQPLFFPRTLLCEAKRPIRMGFEATHTEHDVFLVHSHHHLATSPVIVEGPVTLLGLSYSNQHLLVHYLKDDRVVVFCITILVIG